MEQDEIVMESNDSTIAKDCRLYFKQSEMSRNHPFEMKYWQDTPSSLAMLQSVFFGSHYRPYQSNSSHKEIILKNICWPTTFPLQPT